MSAHVHRPDIHGEAIPTCLACPWTPRYEELARALDQVIAERDAVQQQLTRTLAEKAKLKNELERALQETDLAEPAQEVYDYWLDVIEGGSKRIRFTAVRAKAVQARLNEGHTVADLKLAIDGAKVGAYVDEKGVRHDGLELICRNSEKVRTFRKKAIAHAQAVQREHSQIAQRLVERYGLGAKRDLQVKWSSQAELWPCPCCAWDERFPESPSLPQSLCIDYDRLYVGCLTCRATPVQIYHALEPGRRHLRSVA